MAGRPRDPAQLARDRKKIAQMYLEGQTQYEIASALGLSQPTVSNDLAYIREEWIKSSLVDFNERKARELAKIDAQELRYLGGWLRSCESRTDTVQYVEDGGDGDPEESRAVVRTAEQNGDPRFLAGIDGCIDRRIKLFGLADPETFRIIEENDFDYEKWVADRPNRLAAALALVNKDRGANEEATDTADTGTES